VRFRPTLRPDRGAQLPTASTCSTSWARVLSHKIARACRELPGRAAGPRDPDRLATEVGLGNAPASRALRLNGGEDGGLNRLAADSHPNDDRDALAEEHHDRADLHALLAGIRDGLAADIADALVYATRGDRVAYARVINRNQNRNG
jgi:hypothetical protein